MLRQAVLIGVLVSVVATTAEAQIYTWRDDAGTLVLSDRPRDANARTVGVGRTRAFRTTRATMSPDAARYDGLIERHAAAHGVRADLVRAVIQVESGFDPRAVSSKGALGLMQLMPAPAAELGVSDPFDPAENIRDGITYLRWLLDRYDGNEELALAAYNAGPGAVEQYGNRVPPYRETRDFVGLVQGRTDLAAAGSGTTIYKSYDVIDGRRIPSYSNVKPADGEYEVAGRRR